MKRSYSTFERLCRQTFQFLVDDFGFKLTSIERGPINVGIHITYKSPVTAVEVSFEPRENTLFVSLIRFVNGKMPEYLLKYPMNTFYVDELIDLKSPSLRVEQKKTSELLSSREVQAILKQYADALRQIGADVLRGDMRVFSELEKRRNVEKEKSRQ